MKRFLTISILAAAVILVSCVNTIKYEYDLNDGKITVLSQLSTADTLHSVFLSLSYPDRIDSLSGATVSCYVNGTLHRAAQAPTEYYESYDWETMEPILIPMHSRYTEYRFKADIKPGDKVRIVASKDGDEAWAEIEVPAPGVIVSMDTSTVVKTFVWQDLDGAETYEQEFLEFTVRLADVKGSDSYFTLDGDISTFTKLTSEDSGKNSEEFAGPDRLNYETFHDLILEDGYSSGLGNLFEDLMPVNAMHCFSDKMFRDGEATVKLYFPSYDFRVYPYYYDADKIEVEKTFRLRLKSIDHSFYNYLRALNNMLCYGFEVEPIIEPTMLPNNVNGGMGIVTVAAESFLELHFEKVVYRREDFIYYGYESE
ncbi:MAG: DUF4249 domain-containing protein [Bacteroidales bacterium]|nr:DUF4249 domain-containing protein [Bacteroidales bacterium]